MIKDRVPTARSLPEPALMRYPHSYREFKLLRPLTSQALVVPMLLFVMLLRLAVFNVVIQAVAAKCSGYIIVFNDFVEA